MTEKSELRFKEPGMRLLENEHAYLTFLMNEWHALVLSFEDEGLSLEAGRENMKILRQNFLSLLSLLKIIRTKKKNSFFPH